MHRMLHQVLWVILLIAIFIALINNQSFNLKNNNHYDILQEMRRNAATGNEILYEVWTTY